MQCRRIKHGALPATARDEARQYLKDGQASERWLGYGEELVKRQACSANALLMCPLQRHPRLHLGFVWVEGQSGGDGDGGDGVGVVLVLVLVLVLVVLGS